MRLGPMGVRGSAHASSVPVAPQEDENTAAPQVVATPPSRDPPQPATQSQGFFQQLLSRSPPDTLTRRPFRHLNTNRKLQDWGLCVRKTNLILGDSNLSRFPPFQHQDLQIDSYPGATFRHAESVLRKALSNRAVKMVILAFGINSRNQKPHSTTIKQLQGALRVAKRKFPEATILVPELNFSDTLPQKEKSNLKVLNTYITTSCDYIPQLPNQDFRTDRDGVHWSHHTASRMLDHWLSQVN